MSRHADNPLPRLVQSFFLEHLARVRGASRHTTAAYRDALRLFFMFLSDKTGRSVATLRLEDLDVSAVSGFLSHLETKRRNSIATRNCRLAALRCFFQHLARHDPEHADQYHRVLSLPFKKAPVKVVPYLEPEEVRRILEQPDRQSKDGQRDQALLLFLYNTGARVSEALDLRIRDIERTQPPQVRLRGKGGRERLCPLWSNTLQAIDRLPTMQHTAVQQPVFLSARGKRLTRDGVAYILTKYVTLAARDSPQLRRRRVTPHVLRHSCAVALLQAGVDVSVIRDYLGHASVATTSRYITTNLRMKREVLETFWRHAGLTPQRAAPWRPSADVLTFLASL
jgi:site-specific recombinase XerD